MQYFLRPFGWILPLCAGLVACQEPTPSEPSDTPEPPIDDGRTPSPVITPSPEVSPSPVVTPTPLPPAPSAQLQGLVLDLSGSPLPDVEVRVNGSLLARTSAEGAFLVPDLPEDTEASVEVSRHGFSSAARSILLSASSPSTLRFTLEPTRDAVLDFAELGGQVVLPDGLQLDFPPYAVEDASGLPVSGPVELTYTLLDDPDELPLAPGDFRAIQEDGTQTLLESFGMVEIRLFQEGMPLQLGAPVTLRFPLFEARDYLEGQSIGLWSFDVDSGLWQEEGLGQVQYQDGRAVFEATVSHFTWWNCDAPLEDTHCLEGQAVDPEGNGVAGLTVEASGEDYSGGSSTQTASDGRFCANVKRGSVNRLHVYGGTPARMWEASASGIVAGESATECALGGCTQVPVLVLQQTSDKDQDGVTVLQGDCDDAQASVFPGASEQCDGLDDNCNGTIDEGLSNVQPYHRDADSDGFGDAAVAQDACAKPAGYVLDDTDCDDTRAYIYPAALETCNGRDDDCDGTLDEGTTSTVYPDADLDGYGLSAGPTLESCGIPTGYSRMTGDCDDTLATVYPNAVELCDALDNDCDSRVDEDVSLKLYPDLDGDGYGASGSSPVNACVMEDATSLNALDCNDLAALISPAADELPNGLDDNCNGEVDENFALQYPDQDGDGYGASSAGELLPINTSGYSLLTGDCVDTDPAIYPSAVEVCDDKDNDCDGTADEDLPMQTWYRDADSDGYGETASTLSACAQPTGYSSQGGDCLDSDAALHPGAAETCNGQDDDCDGTLDDGMTLERFYLDGDGDGFGDASSPIDACAQPEGAVSNLDDCDDTATSTHPGAAEACDQRDNDCDALIDEDFSAKFYPDEDGDGYGAGETWSCEGGADTALNTLDCDDADADVYPAAPDTAGDGVDQSCDGVDGLAPSVGLPTSTFTAIQAALDAALAGQTVWVGPGTYHEYGLTLRGKALTLSGTAGADATVIDAQGKGSVLVLASGEGEDSVIQHLTLTGGMAQDGGGIFCSGASPLLSQLILVENTATAFGGGFIFKGGAPVFRDSRVHMNVAANGAGGVLASWTGAHLETVFMSENDAAWTGGALFISSARAVLRDVKAEGNTANEGGGLLMEGGELEVLGGAWRKNSSTAHDPYYGGGGMMLLNVTPILKDVEISGNSAHDGGGMYLAGSFPTLTQVTFTGNTADGSGGGMYVESSTPFLKLVTFTGNTASNDGGGMYLNYSSPPLKQVTFTGNSASYSGGGMYLSESSFPTLSQVTFSGNSASYSGGGMFLNYSSSPTLINSILAYNRASSGGNFYNNYSSRVKATDSLVYNPSGWGTDNLTPSGTYLTVEPQFLDYADSSTGASCTPGTSTSCLPADLHPALGSPLIDAGDPTLTDVDGSRSDIGSYGGQGGDDWDVDGDGLPDYFWPGEWEDAPAGFDPSDYDRDDLDPGRFPRAARTHARAR